MISYSISSFFFYTFSFCLNIIKSPQYKNKKVETIMYKNYVTGQTALTLNLDFAIPNNHLANAISWFVDSIPEGRYCQNQASCLSPSHDAQDLALCLFSQSILRQKNCADARRKASDDGTGRASKDLIPYYQ